MTSGQATTARSAAFFDVDETLITRKSMLSFLRDYYRWLGRPDAAADDTVASLRDIAAGPGGRAASNRAYYRLFAGHRVAEVAAAGQQWFDDGMTAGGLFHPAALLALREHQQRGDLVVLVSGSFSACLDPIARYVHADIALGTVPEVSGGSYTGEVHDIRIGAGKAEAVAEVLRERELRPEDCHAYGDHASDLDLLRQVGHPVVVGDDPVLLEHAHRGRWRRLPPAVAAVRGVGAAEPSVR
nr:HAD-IB family hydrolase [Streptomyces sp.]